MEQEGFEVRDLRKKEKFIIDDAYLNGYAKICGIYSTGVYISLCRHADKDQKAFPSYQKIAEELAISEKQVGRALKILIDHRIIKRERIGKKANNRYWLLDKSEWTGSPISERTDRPITTDSQSSHLRTDSPIHSKETHVKETHSKELILSPAEETKKFFDNSEIIIPHLIEKGIPENFARQQIKYFIDYWTERNKSGTKQRWEMQPTFEVKRRLVTWFNKNREFQSNKNEVKGIRL